MLRAAFLLFLAILVSACSRHATFIEAATDPALSASKNDPIFVVLPNKPTITERRLAPVLRSELCKNGFQVVNSQSSAKWVMGLVQDRHQFYGGASATTAVLPNIGIAKTTTTAEVVTNETIYLQLFDAQEFGLPDTLALWEASSTASTRVFQIYDKVMIKNALDYFGKNFAGRTRLSKEYLKASDDCAN